MKRPFPFLIGALVLLFSGCVEFKTAPLPDDPIAYFPKMKEGDAYSFSISETEKGQWEVISVDKNGNVRIKERMGGSRAPSMIRAERQEIGDKSDKRETLTFQGDEQAYLKNIKLDFPLFPGKRWSYGYATMDTFGRPVTVINDYKVKSFETVKSDAGPLKVFKVSIWSKNNRPSAAADIGELWYSPDAKMVIFYDLIYSSYKILAYTTAPDQAGPQFAAQKTAAPALSPAPSAAINAEAVRIAEEKVAVALKAQQEKEAELKVQAQRLAEREAALKAEANRLTEEKLAADAKRLEEREAALKAEAARLENEKRAAAAKAKRDQEAAAKALALAKARAEAENIEADIPRTAHANPDAIAVVIGNRDYKNAKKVSFAVNDAELVIKYLVNTLGYKEGNIFFLANASKTEFELYFGNDKNYRGKLFNAVKDGRSDVFIYYSGHGAPGLKDRKGYFVPTEADPQYLELSGYPLDVLYDNLAKLPSRTTTVVLDACFSGSTIYENISPLVLEVQDPVIKVKNMVVLASAKGTQVSSWYNEKGHSLFTYFLLRTMKDRTADSNRDGKLTFDEVYTYIADKSEGVPYYARRINGVEQNPTISGQYHGRIFLTY